MRVAGCIYLSTLRRGCDTVCGYSRTATVYLPDYFELPNKSNLCLCQFTGWRIIRSSHLKQITDKCRPREMNNLCRFTERILINLSRMFCIV